MLFFADESGDYAFPTRGFDCYVLLGLVCPEPQLSAIDKFVAAAKARWGLVELHGAALHGRELLEVCRFVASIDVTAVAVVTDTAMMTRTVIQRFRSKQLAQIQAERVAWTASAGDAPHVDRELSALEKVVLHVSRLPDSEFVQATLPPQLLRDVIQRAIDRYDGEESRPYFAQFDFTFDEKLPGKLSQGQKYMNLMYMRVLGTNKRFLITPPAAWIAGNHPYVANFTIAGKPEPAKLFANGLATRDSKDVPGLQIADVIASVVRRSVLRTDMTPAVRASYDSIRGVLADSEGRCLQMYRYEEGNEGIPEIYRPLYTLPGIRVTGWA
jgi:Protein of unknown function (DUF3800)